MHYGGGWIVADAVVGDDPTPAERALEQRPRVHHRLQPAATRSIAPRILAASSSQWNCSATARRPLAPHSALNSGSASLRIAAAQLAAAVSRNMTPAAHSSTT